MFQWKYYTTRIGLSHYGNLSVKSEGRKTKVQTVCRKTGGMFKWMYLFRH